MSRSVEVPLAWLAAAFIAAQSACTIGAGREDLAVQRLETELCEKAVECGCLDEAPECGAWPPSFISESSRAFDPACVDRWIDWLDRLSCQAPVLPSYADLCPLYHGTLREGEPCQTSSLTDTDCERGLLCIAGACRDPQSTALRGAGQPCDLGPRCDGDLECIDELCERLPGPGELCLAFRCDATAECDSERCVALPGPGQACSGVCSPPAFCRFDLNGFGECLHPGDVGDPCQGHRECESGNCPAGSCEYPAKVGDACSDRLPCGPGQSCIEGLCQAVEGVSAGSACNLVDAL